MKIESFLLGEIGQSTDRAVPEMDDTTLDVPNVVLPVVMSARAFDIGNTAVLNNSGMRFVTSRVLNGVDSIATFVTLTKGLWRLQFDQAYSSNYQSTGATAGDGFLRFTLDNGFSLEWAGFYAHTSPGSQVRSFRLDLNVRGNLVIDQFLRGNGVGQEHRLYTALLANKML